ncbi:MAG: V-type ATP synthase subunit E [Thermoplasmata archaeon]|nr:MAG: V-type ATP synthase subunit E [Thermoplasmata archaeon]
MGAVENITSRIKKDASQKAKQQIDEAKKEAKKILSQAKSELEKEKRAMELETEKVIKIQRSRATSEGKLEARKMMLNAKEDVISKAFALAEARLKEVDLNSTERYISAALKSAATEMGSEFDVLCNAKDQQLVQRLASAVDPRIKVSSQGFDNIGGLVILAKDGTSRIDATFEGVLERLRNDLRREVAEILFQAKQAKVKEE